MRLLSTAGHPDVPKAYSLDWRAEGTSFFDDFNFLTHDGNHGASHFLGSFQEAQAAGVAEAAASHAVLRAGSKSPQQFKRETAKIGTKKAWTHFLAMLKFSHVPHGCGVWPAFFTLGEGQCWVRLGGSAQGDLCRGSIRASRTAELGHTGSRPHKSAGLQKTRRSTTLLGSAVGRPT